MSVARLGVILSGRGSNFAAIQAAIESGQLPNAKIVMVLSNHVDAPGLTLARSKKIPTVWMDKANFTSRINFDAAVTAALQAHGVGLVILAGYDRIIGEPLLSTYANRILNIHPSLLPAYGGKNMVGLKVHQAVLENKEPESGCSVHLVTADVDGGPILGQSRVPVLENDTPAALAARILEQEHALYPRVIGEAIRGLRDTNQGVQGNAYEQNLRV